MINKPFSSGEVFRKTSPMQEAFDFIQHNGMWQAYMNAMNNRFLMDCLNLNSYEESIHTMLEYSKKGELIVVTFEWVAERPKQYVVTKFYKNSGLILGFTHNLTEGNMRRQYFQIEPDGLMMPKHRSEIQSMQGSKGILNKTDYARRAEIMTTARMRSKAEFGLSVNPYKS